MNILYFLSTGDVGSAYKNINFMCENFGGHIVRGSVAEAIRYICKSKPELIVVRDGGRNDCGIALRYGIPYILIENDVSSMRRGMSSKSLEGERTKIERAAAILLTSEDHASYLEGKYKMPYHRVIHTRPLRKDLDFEPKPKKLTPSLVYAGGLNQWDHRSGDFGYRCYHTILKAFIDAGWEVHLYPAYVENRRLSEYKELGCVVHSKLPYQDLLRELSQYTAGLHSYNREGVPEKAYNYTQTCRGNKIWDYLAAGIPTIGYQGGKGMDIYRNKWGIVIQSLSKDNLSTLPRRLEKIKITEEMRLENTMDSDFDVYQEIIEKALEAPRVSISRPTIPEWGVNDVVIQVTNNRPQTVYRGGKAFEPYKTTEPFVVSQSQWKEIKSHVGLRIIYVQGG